MITQRGFTLIEVLICGVLLAFGLLAMSGMFISGYANIARSGRSTTALAAGRQFLEDARRLPLANLANLDGFDTDDPGTLPAADPELEIARRWRYVLAGEGVGWTFTADELDRWPPRPDEAEVLGAAGRVQVSLDSPTLARVSITIRVPGARRTTELFTLVAGE
jgi:prepilin-type N-terminal cleavage/methylation domain-containing protein